MYKNIEILSVNPNHILLLKSACEPLNRVQNIFTYIVVDNSYSREIHLNKREEYSTEDVYSWIGNYRKISKGEENFTILVVDGILKSQEWYNLLLQFLMMENLLYLH